MKRLIHWLKFFLLLVLIGGCFFGSGMIYNHYWPRFKSFVLVEIKAQSEELSPLKIIPRQVDFTVFPLQVSFNDVLLRPKEELAEKLAPLKVKSIRLEPSFFAFLKGQLRLKRILIDSPKFTFIGDIDTAKTEQDSPQIDLDQIFSLPIESIQIQNLEGLVRLKNLGLDLKISQADLRIDNYFRSALIEMNLPELTSKEPGRTRAIRMSLGTRALVTKSDVKLSFLKAVRDDSFIIASGEAKGSIETGLFDSAAVEMKTRLNLLEVSDSITSLFPQKKFPELSGVIEVEGRINQLLEKRPALAFQIEGQELTIQKRIIGAVAGRGLVNQTGLQIKELLFNLPSGEVRLEKTQMKFKEPYSFQGTANVKKFSLPDFLSDIKVVQVPMTLDLSGRLPCRGQISHPFVLTCDDAKINGRNLIVYPNLKSKDQIVSIPAARAEGNVKVTSSSVSYGAQVQMGQDSTGSSTGKISYKEGFDIQYESPNFDFKDLESLGGLKLEGQGRLSGSTKGTSDWGTLEIQADANDIWINDFGLGQVKTQVKYKEGVLSFSEAQGKYQDSRYSGDVSVLFREERLVANIEAPYVELVDLKKLFGRRLSIPIELQGSGAARFRIDGAIDPQLWSFDLNSNLRRVELASEEFESLDLKVRSERGLIRAQQVELRKATGSVKMEGQMTSDFDTDLIFVGRGLRIEQSDTIQKMGLDLNGQGDFTMSLKGPLRSPRTELFGRLSKMTLGDRPAADSNFQLLFLSSQIEGQGQLLGDSLSGEFTIPLNDQAPFRLNAKARELDLTRLFSFFSSMSRSRDFQTKVTSEIQLTSPSGGIWNSTGQIKVSEFELLRGPIGMRLTQPATVRANRGVFSSKPILIGGGENTLKIEINNTRSSKLDIQANGKFELGLMAFLTPMLSTLRGELSLGLSVSGTAESPSFGGVAFVKDGQAVIEAFPQPIDSIQADLLFTEQSILINSARGLIGGGTIDVIDGRLRLGQKKGVRVDVSGNFKNVSLTQPEDIESEGSGTFSLAGQGLPLTLGLYYNVRGGLFSKEFTESESKDQVVKPSSLLPSFVTRLNQSPILFDFDIEATEPVRVKNENLDAPIKGRIQLKGPPDDLRVQGTLTTLPGSKLNFKDTDFDIQAGLVEYRGEPISNPRLYVSAQSTVVENWQEKGDSDQRNEYDVSLLIQGRVPEFKISLSSQPALSESEIISLLALGMTSSALQQSSASGTPNATSGIQIGASLLQKPLGKGLKDKTGFELQISSDTEEKVSSPKFTLRRQITPKVAASASRTIEERPKQKYKLEYKFNRHFSTIGSWEVQEQDLESTKDSSSSGNKLGIDFEYRVNFK